MRAAAAWGLLAAVTLAAAAAQAHDSEEPHSHGEAPPPDGDWETGGDEAGGELSPSGEPRPRSGRIPPIGRVESEADEVGDAPAERSEELSRPAATPPDHPRRETIPDSTWRKGTRRRTAQMKGRTDDEMFEPGHFHFEVRFGPYWAEPDEELGGEMGPYETVFGTKARFYFGLELDWLPLHIPYVGSVGPAFGWGWTRAKGLAFDDAGNPVVDEAGEPVGGSSMWIMPMHVSAVLRADGPLRRWGVPVVPYAKIGFGFGIWKASGPAGTSSVQVGEETVEAKGNSLGMHLAIGGAVAVSELVRDSAIQLRESTAIDYISVWGEWMWANLDGIGNRPQMHIGSSTVVVGLGIDF